jgi:hypothetical protein
MGIRYIRDTYKVPAKRGMRIRHYVGGGRSVFGVITGARNAHILVRLDGYTFSLPFHPTWCMEYLGAAS